MKVDGWMVLALLLPMFLRGWMDGCWWIKCGEQREEEGSPVIADGERLLRTVAIERGRATH